MGNIMNWRTVMRERITSCGEYLMIQYYPVKALSNNKKRQRKYRTSREAQKRLNAKNSRYKLIALVHQNFTPNDVIVTLTYDKDHLPKNDKEAHSAMYNFIRRFKREWCRKKGKPQSAFKYIEVMETGRKGRVHHHIIITGGVELHRIKKIWKNGDVHAKYANFDENGITGFVRYITKDSPRIRYKRWSASKNLEKPQIIMRDEAISLADARFIEENPLGCESFLEEMHQGYTVCPYSVEVSSFEGLHTAPYISFMMYRTDNRYIRPGKWERTHSARTLSGNQYIALSDRSKHSRGQPRNTLTRPINPPVPKMLQ